MITTYSLIVRDAIFQEKAFSYVILDEAQKIKNPKTKMAITIKELKSDHTLALSETPIENHLGELWSLFSFLMPGFLGTQNYFNTVYKNPIEKENSLSAKERLLKRVSPFLLRRTKESVLSELPPKTEIIKYTQFDDKQAKLYESVRISMDQKIRDAIAKNGLNRSHITILDALLKLRQICCDPALLGLKEAKNVKESAKMTLIFELLEELLEENRKILLFSQFTSMLSIIEEELNKRNITYVKLTGQTRKREEAIEKFTKDEKCSVFLISLKAGGVGLNLTEADTVIHCDPWWNPSVENQATDRAHRIGQDKKVFVYKLIVENSIEEKILSLQEKKAGLQSALYSDKEKSVSSEELLGLLGKSEGD